MVFLSTDPGHNGAGQYGQYVARYRVMHGRLLDSASPEAQLLAEEFCGEKFSAEDWEDVGWPEFYAFPTREFAAFLKARGYDGFRTGTDLAIVDHNQLHPFPH